EVLAARGDLDRLVASIGLAERERGRAAIEDPEPAAIELAGLEGGRGSGRQRSAVRRPGDDDVDPARRLRAPRGEELAEDADRHWLVERVALQALHRAAGDVAEMIAL